MTTTTHTGEESTAVIPDATSSPRSTAPLRRAPIPRRPAQVGLVGMVLAIALGALGALAIYDAVQLLWTGGEPLLTPVLTGTASVEPDAVTAVLAGVVALVGLLLLWSALRRGAKRGAHLEAVTGVWMAWSDIERLAAATAERTDGVLTARSRASAREVRIGAETTADGVEPAITAAVDERLQGLARTPKVSVRTTRKGGVQ